MNILRHHLPINAAILAIAIPAFSNSHAQSVFRYTFIEAAYLRGEYAFPDSELDIDGYSITAQFDYSASFAFGVTYTSLEGDDSIASTAGTRTLDFKGSGPDVFAFYHAPVGPNTDFIFGAQREMSDRLATVVEDDIDFSRNEDVDSLLAGLRLKFSGLELQSKWFYNLDAEDDEDEWSYTVGLLSGDPAGLQLGIQFRPDDTGDLFGISVRQSY